MSFISAYKQEQVKFVQKNTNTRPQVSTKLIDRSEMSLKAGVSYSSQDCSSKRTTSVIDHVLFHHSIDISLEKNDDSLQSLIVQEKKRNSNSKEEFLAEYTVLKFNHPNAGISFKYIKINRSSQDQRVPQHVQTTYCSKNNNMAETKAAKHTSSVPSSRSKDNIKSDTLKIQESHKYKSVQSTSLNDSLKPEKHSKSSMTRSTSINLKEKDTESKSRKSSVNDNVTDLPNQETPRHRNSNLGKYLENKRSSTLPKQINIIATIQKELNIIEKANSLTETKLSKEMHLSSSILKENIKEMSIKEEDTKRKEIHLSSSISKVNIKEMSIKEESATSKETPNSNLVQRLKTLNDSSKPPSKNSILMTRSTSSNLKEKDKESKSRKTTSSVNDIISDSPRQATSSHKNSNLGKYLENKRSSTLPKQNNVIATIETELFVNNSQKIKSLTDTKVEKMPLFKKSSSKEKIGDKLKSNHVLFSDSLTTSNLLSENSESKSSFEPKQNSLREKRQKERILEVTEEAFQITKKNYSFPVQRSKSNIENMSPLRSFISSKDKEIKNEKGEVGKLSIECCTNNESFQDTIIGLKDASKLYSSNLDMYLPDWYQKRFFYNKSTEWKEYPNNLVDTHCHFEMLFFRMRYEKQINEYLNEFECYYFQNFHACIDVICDPLKYFPKAKLEKYLERLNHPKVYFTIGCHPHFAFLYSDNVKDLIVESLKLEKVVAIGECGLDASKKNRVPIEIQRKAFKSQLEIAAETQAPIVIHCRDLEAEAFEMLKENLTPTHKIHLHCFTGSWDMAQSYLKYFPNLCIGVTGLLTNIYATNVNEMVKNIPIERLLLETDSPFFIPSEFPQGVKVAHPGFVFAVAESVAKIKHISVSNVLDSNRRNVKKIYSF